MKHRSNPPLIAARSFEAAARCSSFQRAAHELHVTPTAISHQVKRLEEYLGVQLFLRKNRAVVLTPAGEKLANRLNELFISLEDLLAPASLNTTPLRVTAMPSLAAKWLAHRLAEYRNTHPDLPVELSDDDEVVDFADGRFDLGLRYGEGVHPGTIVHAWMNAPVIAVCSPTLVRTELGEKANLVERLQNSTLIHDSTTHLPGKPPGWNEWFAAMALSRPLRQTCLHYSSVYIALEAARGGKGFALAPEPLARDDLRTGALIAPFDLVLENPYAFWIAYPRRLENDQRVRTFTSWLQNCR